MDKLVKRLPIHAKEKHKKPCLQYLYKTILKTNSFLDAS
jgi:hypothetical protein